MSDDHLRTYEDTGLREGSNRAPGWLIALWVAVLALGVIYLIKFV